MSTGKGLSILGVNIFGAVSILSGQLSSIGLIITWIGMFIVGCMILYKGE